MQATMLRHGLQLLPFMKASSLLLVLSFTPWPLGVETKVTPNGAMVWNGNGWIALVDDDSSPLPPPPKTDSWKSSEATIFLGISSYRDQRCPQTLKNYFEKAKYPKRLTIGIVQQNDKEDVDCLKKYCELMNAKEGPKCPFYSNIRILRVEAKNAAGPCYGRHMQSYMLRDEEFCMQTDSHMDAVRHWDSKLMEMWGRVNNEYGILTTYVHAITQVMGGAETGKEVPHLCQLSFTSGENHPRYVQAKIANRLPRPTLTSTWAAGLSLAKCHAWKAAPYDPALRMVFNGEEFSMHARLWTRGYDTYTPDKSLIGHDYTPPTDGPRPSSWIQNPMAEGTKRKAYTRLFTLLGMPGKSDDPKEKEKIGKYGLGTKRTMEQYQEFVGVNLSTLEITGSRCGTLRHVPFEETWPPTENNLGGPYWGRKLAGKGIYGADYIPLFGAESAGGRQRSWGSSEHSTNAGGDSNVARGSLGTGLLLTGVLCCCIVAITRCAGPDVGGPGRRFLSQRKPYGKGRTSRRTNPLVGKEVI